MHDLEGVRIRSDPAEKVRNEYAMLRTRGAIALLLVFAIGVHATAQNQAAAPGSSRGTLSTPNGSGTAQVLPGTPQTAFGTIHISALSAANSPLPRWIVRLRDARYGRLVATNLTDDEGSFTFRDVDPGTYIIELIGGDQTVRATSALLAVNAGASVFAVVRLPTERGAITALLSVALAQAAALTMALAGSADVPPVQPTTPVSPR
jgi:hypothetical protein